MTIAGTPPFAMTPLPTRTALLSSEFERSARTLKRSRKPAWLGKLLIQADSRHVPLSRPDLWLEGRGPGYSPTHISTSRPTLPTWLTPPSPFLLTPRFLPPTPGL